MSGPVFVLDAQGTPLMPMAPAYARKLIRAGKAHKEPHHAFTVIKLSKVLEQPKLSAVIAVVRCRLHTAELMIVVPAKTSPQPLLRIIVDLATDLPARLRRRAGHRRRRRLRGRYRALRRQGVPFKLRRPHLHRSQWGSRHRQRLSRPERTPDGGGTATIRWRAEAVERVLQVLYKLIPISSIVLYQPERRALLFEKLTPAERRRLLVDTYGVVTSEGQRIARCCYCGTTRGAIEVDHILPRCRGGTNAWDNLVLACRDCNRRKGEQTPQEAGMALVVGRRGEPPLPQRSQPYIWQTADLLHRRLSVSGQNVEWLHEGAGSGPEARGGLHESVEAADVTSFVAKPIGRGRRQIYTARNYPLSTPLTAGFVRVGDTVKRRVRVNQALLIQPSAKKARVRVVASPTPEQDGFVIRLGMLCQGVRAGKSITGIVGAVQSNARLALLTLDEGDASKLRWRRVLISPRLGVRVLSTDAVVFLHLTSSNPSG